LEVILISTKSDTLDRRRRKVKTEREDNRLRDRQIVDQDLKKEGEEDITKDRTRWIYTAIQ